jgi:carbon monoxide dehydrogenase subunit G
MNIRTEFSVAAALDDVWADLLDIEAVAPCVPGATLTERVSEREFRGTVTVKLGAMRMTYRGTVELTEIDEAAKTIRLTARANDARGAGSASSVVTCRLTDGDRVTVTVEADVNIAGKVAQFGRGLIQDVTDRMIKQFAQCLEEQIAGNESATVASADVGVLPVLGEVGKARATQGINAVSRLLNRRKS